MSDLRLPFWVLFDDGGEHPPSAFTTTNKLELLSTPTARVAGRQLTFQTASPWFWPLPTFTSKARPRFGSIQRRAPPQGIRSSLWTWLN